MPPHGDNADRATKSRPPASRARHGGREASVQKVLGLVLTELQRERPRFAAVDDLLEKIAPQTRRAVVAALVKRYLSKPTAATQNRDRLVDIRQQHYLWKWLAVKERRRAQRMTLRSVLRLRGRWPTDIEQMVAGLGTWGVQVLARETPPSHPDLYRYDNQQVVASSCLLARFWKRVDAKTRLAAARRFMRAVKGNATLAKLNMGSALVAIGLLGQKRAEPFLAQLLRGDADVSVRAHAAVALRIVAKANPQWIGAKTRDAVVAQLLHLTKQVRSGRTLTNPRARGVNYLFHLLELLPVLNDGALFGPLAAVIKTTAARRLAEDQQRQLAMIRLLVAGFLMRIDPKKALVLAGAHLPQNEHCPHEVLLATILDNAVYIWKRLPQKRPALLKALRQSLRRRSWIARIIGIEGLAAPGLRPRRGVPGDIAALRKVVRDQRRLRGDDWKGATVSKRARKAIKTLQAARRTR